jgi:branched-chain amino acid transport system ATP-binding protein
MSILTLHDIRKRFGLLEVLSGVDLTVGEGERHALIGPNGAGKSTLFNIISGRLRPTAGSVRCAGQDITDWAPGSIVKLGVARGFQVINVFPQLSVHENVRAADAARMGRRFDFYNRIDRLVQLAEETAEVLALVQLEGRRRVMASELSYGDQRRLEIGLVAALKPKVMLLDEPCAGLNPIDTDDAIQLIRRITANCTLLMVEHDMNVVFELADRVTVLHSGRVLATGAPEAIRKDEAVAAAYLGRRAHVA